MGEWKEGSLSLYFREKKTAVNLLCSEVNKGAKEI